LCSFRLSRVMKISFGGYPLRTGCSMLDLCTMLLLHMIALLSLGRVFGGIRLIRESCSLLC
jgi:hypothetical protein